MKPLRILSYNIHKGFSANNLSFILAHIKGSIEETHADLVLLQEVLGHKKNVETSQFEYLADRLWPHHAYGKNAVYTSGHHGNAILSKYPISFWENQDVSLSQYERRGLLHAAIDIPGWPEPFHAVCVHLGLFENDRRSQIDDLCARIQAMVPPACPLIVGGDFNDWRGSATDILKEKLGMREAFLEHTGSHARSFPSWWPVLKLDRMYFRGLMCESVELIQKGPWSSISDHLPILATFKP